MSNIMELYREMAGQIEDVAPAQARLLRYFIVNEGHPKEADEIMRAMDCTESNFRVLVNKLRSKGVELVCTRVHAPESVSEDVRYVYSISPMEVADWETLRKKGIMTAWDRMTEMFLRSLHSLGIQGEDIGEVRGTMKSVRTLLTDLDFRLGLRIEADRIKAEQAAEEAAEAVEAEADIAEVAVV